MQPSAVKIRLAARHEFLEPHVLRNASALGLQHAHDLGRAGLIGNEFDLPDTLTGVAAVLLEHAGARRRQPRGKGSSEFGRAAVEVRVGAPPEPFRAVQDFLDAHLHDDVGVRADPRAAGGNVAQQRVERGARPALMDRIDPHEDAVRRQQLLAHVVGKFLGIDRGLGTDAERVQLFENAVEAIVLRRCGPPRLRVAAPEDRDLISL